MTRRALVPAGPLGQRLRKALVAGVLLTCTYTVWWLVREPRWDGWWDAFSWPQSFLYAPVLFFFGAMVWQFACFLVEWFSRKANRKIENLGPEAIRANQWTVKFWLRDSLRICLLYITTCVIGDVPMLVNYLAAVRGWPLHWWWSSVVDSCLLCMVVVWWILARIYS
jgi:hypothetical protein